MMALFRLWLSVAATRRYAHLTLSCRGNLPERCTLLRVALIVFGPRRVVFP